MCGAASGPLRIATRLRPVTLAKSKFHLGEIEMQRLAGKVAIVTGAAQGIGATLAKGIAAEGAKVVIADVIDGEATAQAITRDNGAAIYVKTDVANAASVQAMVERAVKEFGTGTNIPQPFVDVEAAALDRLLQLNVRAAFMVAQAAVRRMRADADRRERGGAVVNISSQLGRVAMKGRGVYVMTKHAVEGMTKALAWELGPHGIRVNTLCPTFIRTPMTEPMLKEPGFEDFVRSRIALGRIGTVRDVMGAVVFLASEAAGLVTGSALMVDGGWTAI